MLAHNPGRMILSSLVWCLEHRSACRSTASRHPRRWNLYREQPGGRNTVFSQGKPMVAEGPFSHPSPGKPTWLVADRPELPLVSAPKWQGYKARPSGVALGPFQGPKAG